MGFNNRMTSVSVIPSLHPVSKQGPNNLSWLARTSDLPAYRMAQVLTWTNQSWLHSDREKEALSSTWSFKVGELHEKKAHNSIKPSEESRRNMKEGSRVLETLEFLWSSYLNRTLTLRESNIFFLLYLQLCGKPIVLWFVYNLSPEVCVSKTWLPTCAT